MIEGKDMLDEDDLLGFWSYGVLNPVDVNQDFFDWINSLFKGSVLNPNDPQCEGELSTISEMNTADPKSTLQMRYIKRHIPEHGFKAEALGKLLSNPMSIDVPHGKNGIELIRREASLMLSGTAQEDRSFFSFCGFVLPKGKFGCDLGVVVFLSGTANGKEGLNAQVQIDLFSCPYERLNAKENEAIGFLKGQTEQLLKNKAAGLALIKQDAMNTGWSCWTKRFREWRKD